MDLSSLRFDRDLAAAPSAQDLAVMMVGVAARQAASPTAMLQTKLEHKAATPVAERFAPADGAFSRPVAEALSRWQHE